MSEKVPMVRMFMTDDADINVDELVERLRVHGYEDAVAVIEGLWREVQWRDSSMKWSRRQRRRLLDRLRI